jgi:hypothetical protein
MGHNRHVRGSIFIAAVANIVVAIAAYLFYGWNVVGGAVAARNTARLSSVLFAVALASHFHSRYGRDYVALIKVFIAAHIVHFGTVVAYHAILGKLSTPMFWGIASTGSILLGATALTITKMPRTHLGLTYVIWLAFMVALGSRISKDPLLEGPFLALVVLAMLIHFANAIRRRKIDASAASA